MKNDRFCRAFAEGRDEQIIHNRKLYKHVIFAKYAAIAKQELFFEAQRLKSIWQENQSLMADFQSRYNLKKTEFV